MLRGGVWPDHFPYIFCISHRASLAFASSHTKSSWLAISTQPYLGSHPKLAISGQFQLAVSSYLAIYLQLSITAITSLIATLQSCHSRKIFCQLPVTIMRKLLNLSVIHICLTDLKLTQRHGQDLTWMLAPRALQIFFSLESNSTIPLVCLSHHTHLHHHQKHLQNCKCKFVCLSVCLSVCQTSKPL